MYDSHKNIISRYSSELPHLADAFERAAAVRPAERIDWTKQERANIFRDGWFVNTPVAVRGDAENVQEHVQHLVQLIDDYFPAQHKALARAYAECHDDQEVIAHAVIGGIRRDLNPRFNKSSYRISDDDKATIEEAAVDLLFESDPKLKSLWHSYKESSNETASLFAGIDKICVMWRCADFVESGKYAYADFQAYWDYWTPENAEKKLPAFISKTYADEVWPRAEKLRNAPPRLR